MIGRSESATATPRIDGLMQRPFPSSETMAGMILQTDLTRAQLLGEALQNARGKKKFVLGEPLIWLELLPFLPTRMAELHKWFVVQSRANELEMFPARIKDEHFWRGR